MTKPHTYIIAEAGVNHNGSLDLALRLCDAAKTAGADAVKFQTWKTEKIVSAEAPLAEYQQENMKQSVDSQYQMLKRLELSYNDFIAIADHCRSIGIDFLSTPDEEESLRFLLSHFDMKYLKIGSGEVTNIPFLRQAAQLAKRPIILSTGMATMEEVDIAYKTLMDAVAGSVILLHCTTNYPCPYDEVNLKAMCSLKTHFGGVVGYSDHTLGIEVSLAAVAMGAEFIEKHFTLDKSMEGPDHLASADPEELKALVQGIRNLEAALGDGIKRPNASELKNKKVVQKSIVASRDILKGEILSMDNLTTKRIGRGITANNWDSVVGTKAVRNYHIDEPIEIY